MAEEPTTVDAGSAMDDAAEDEAATAATDAGAGDDATTDDALAKAVAEATKKANAEAAKSRRDLNAALAKLKEFEDRDKSETDKLRDEIEALKAAKGEAEQAARTLRAQVALGRAGCTDPDVLIHVIPDDAFEDEASLKRAVAALKKERPRFFEASTGSADGGASGRPAAKTDMNAIIRGYA